MPESRPGSRPASRRSRRGDPPEAAAGQGVGGSGSVSLARTGVAVLVVLVGIAWVVVYTTVAGPDSDGTSLPAMADLEKWNYVIGFGLIFVGLGFAAHPSTPLGRGRGVVVGMLGSFLIGLLWIVTYYVLGTEVSVPLLTDLAQYNLVVGIGFMAVGFIYATHWE